MEDIVQSVFGSFFRRLGQGFYDVPEGDELWKLLLVIALHKIRKKAAYHHAAKRDRHRTIGGEEGSRQIEMWSKPTEFESWLSRAGSRRNLGAVACPLPRACTAADRGL